MSSSSADRMGVKALNFVVHFFPTKNFVTKKTRNPFKF